MKIPFPGNNGLLGPKSSRKTSLSDRSGEALAATPECAGATAEYLMPYETVAKAIFVKANGLPAYYKATGLPKRGC